MGKSQKKKSMRRHNPVRVPDSHLPKGLASAESTSNKTDDILPILQKMGSADASERKWACVAVSNLIYNDPSTRRLLQGKNAVGALITRLSDSEEEVIVEAAGALRNLCIDGGYDICAEMYNKNIIAPLQTFVPKISTTLSHYLEAPQSAPDNARNLVYEFADNIITILWCLSETSNKALSAINQLKLIPFLMSFLMARDRLPLSTVTSAAQCLYVLTDDNSAAIEEIRLNSSYLSCLHGIAKSPDAVLSSNGETPMAEERAIMLSVLTCGILRNISSVPSSSAPTSLIDVDKEILLPILVPVISSASLQDAYAATQRLAQTEPQPITKPSTKGVPGSDHKSAETLELDRIEARLRSIQLALETLTGVCATLPDPDMTADEEQNVEEEEKEIGGDDSAMDVSDEPSAPDDTKQHANGTTNDANGDNSSFLPSILSPLLGLIQPTPLSFPPPGGLSIHPPITSALSAIHIAALECLNNAFLTFAARPNDSVARDVEAGRRVWDEVWRALDLAGTEGGPGQERRMQLWNVGVGVLWAVGVIWSGRLVPNQGQIRALMQLCDSSGDDAVRVKCIGTLESLAQVPDAIDANGVISSYLLSLLPTSPASKPVGIEPVLQAAASLVDIYSDEDRPYDINFRTGGYLQLLVDSVEGVRRAVRGIDRKREGGRELRRRGEEVRDNLVAFIKYRRALKL